MHMNCLLRHRVSSGSQPEEQHLSKRAILLIDGLKVT